MDLSILPSIGRTGIRSAVRNLSSMVLTGWRKIDPSVNFVAGQLAKLGTDTNGNVVVQVVTGTVDKPIGVLYTENTTLFYRPSVAEEHTFGENVSAPNNIYIKPYVKTGTVRVTNSAGSAYTLTTDYTVDLTNGIVTNTGVGITSTGTVYVTYLYKDPNLSGINQPLGSGAAALLEGIGDIATLAYDTTCAWTLNAAVYFDANGYLTATSGSASIGKITKVPTASDPELHVKLNLA